MYSRRRSRVDIDDLNSANPLLGDQRLSRPRQPRIFFHDLRILLFSTHINVLLIFLPFAIVSGALDWSPSVIFATNFFALIPLSLLMSLGTKELCMSIGPTAGGLLGVTFGNSTELIVGIVALHNDQIRLIQTSMLGSILSTLLFVFSRSPPFDKLGTGNNFCCWGHKALGVFVQWMGCPNDEFVDVFGDGQFNPPYSI